MEKDRLPHWDLSEIYPSPESGEFKADLKKVYELRDEIMENLEDFSIKKLIDLLNDSASLCSNLSAYSSALLSTDTSNSTYLKAVGETEDAEIAYEEAYQAFIRSASKRSDEFSSEDLEDYKLFLSEIITLSTHQMSDAEERLASQFLKVSASSWERLQEAITSSASDDGKTLIELRALASHPDREVRKDAYLREKAILKEHETALAYSLNGVKGTTLLLEERRGWRMPLDRSLFLSRISDKALSALISAIEEKIPMFRRYLNVKASLLGLDKLSWYDVIAQVGRYGSMYSFSEA